MIRKKNNTKNLHIKFNLMIKLKEKSILKHLVSS